MVAQQRGKGEGEGRIRSRSHRSPQNREGSNEEGRDTQMKLTEILKVTEIINFLASKKKGNWSQDERRSYEEAMRILDKEIQRRKGRK